MTFLKKATLTGLAVVAFGLPLRCEALPEVDVLFPSKKTVAEKNSVEMFPPLPKDLQEGCVFDQQKVMDKLPQMQNYWYVVPKWLAGEFAYGEMTVRCSLVQNQGCSDFEPLTEANERQKGEYAESLAKLRGFMKEEGKAQDAP